MELKLCESDFKFMCIVWEHEPLASGELVKLCQNQLGWKKSTTYTVLKKLITKGIAKNENTIVTSLAAKSDVQKYASNHIVEESFGGSLPSFLVSFLGGKRISEKEAAELKDLIDQHKE